MNGEHNKKESPEVNGVRSLTWSNIWGPETLPELQKIPELTWCYNCNIEHTFHNLSFYPLFTAEFIAAHPLIQFALNLDQFVATF